MLITQQPILQRFWYPVLPIASLTESPHAFTLLGQPIVLWRDRDGNPAAASDRCCHRSARLSKGVVIDGNIRCPYHGWSYNACGTCVNVPQFTEDQAIPRTYQIPAYRCQERYGYLWVCLAEPLKDIPAIPEAADAGFRQIQEFYETWNVSGLRIMENSFDSAHGNFVHASSWGDIKNPVPPPIDEINETEDGFVMKNWVKVLNPELQKKNLGIAEDKTIRSNERRWYLPFSRTLKITYPNGLIHLIFSAATPIDDRTSQLVQFCFRNDTEAEAKAADVIGFDRQVTQEDRDVLETTDYDAPLSLQEEQHMATDKPGILMRHRLAALLKEHGEVEQRRIEGAL
ncbi:MAG: Rieske (2Fe-2S) protein [Leptolyngbya sp.]|nr:MAG: Rieske (2Fe-2S) protein [Leptolyngbya sp.]